MAIDRTRLSQPTRIALLENFERRTDNWREDVDERMDGFDSKLAAQASRIDVLGERDGIYAALGGAMGSIIIGGIVAALIAFLN